ncbi:OprO/OprP family phosphate-selective porin [Luteimonas sp. BDR2-5]|uniref:OprO/OprP family phosphate-selective porin n=1 Tax=Proluteimonas luteida TaxID=2878685 RepID=UPI001E4D0AC2|nr:porin [Luteimonas sp. BDR2-5]MCD9029745.1 OprO/OprP family phosphate-selective porin [Luteimonas sp. BDR2-5]
MHSTVEKAASLALVVGTILLPGTANASPPDQQALLEIVERQSAEIEMLKSRLSALENQVPAATPATVAAGGSGIEWSDGAPTFTDPDTGTDFRIRGRVLIDASSTFGSDHDDRNITTTGLRSARLGFEGGVGENFFYQFESEFTDNTLEVKGALVGWRSNVGNLGYDVRFGNMLNDRSLESSTGNDETPFLERSITATALNPTQGYFGVGVMARLYGRNWHASLQYVGDDVDDDWSSSDGNALIMRAHFNPALGGETFAHVGGWGYREELSEANPGYSRNTVIGGRLNDNVRVSLGDIGSFSGGDAYGLELGIVHPTTWAFAEAGKRDFEVEGHAAYDSVQADTFNISVGHIFGGAVGYSKRNGRLSRPEISSPISAGGPGALEILARYERLDYRDAPYGGDGSAITLGANWHLTGWSKLMLNLIHWKTDNRSGPFAGPDSGNTVTTRMQVSF